MSETRVHVDIAFELDRGLLGFADQRHFGKVHYAEDRKSSPSLAALGVDDFASEFNEKLFLDLVSKSKQNAKAFLLNQSRIAGIGNIYSCEALWTQSSIPSGRQTL